MASARLALLGLLATCSRCDDAGSGSGGTDDVCPAGGCKDEPASLKTKGEYLFPRARGPRMNEGNSLYSFGGWPCDLKSKLAWSWVPPGGKYNNTGVQAPLVDADGNFYSCDETSARKFSPDGRVMWTWDIPGGLSNFARFRKMPTLFDGLLINSVTSGDAFALHMENGTLAWHAKVSKENVIGNDFGFVIAGEGVVIGDADFSDPPNKKMNKVWALNASTGAHLWDFHPDIGVWNFQPQFLGDGTVAFQSWDGGVYRVRLQDGSALWHSPGGGYESWTDGGPTVGPNNVFYAVRSTAPITRSPFGHPGFLDAYNLTDGSLLWSKALEQAAYTYPAVGHLRPGGPLAVVTGSGSLAGMPLKEYVKMCVEGCVPLALQLGLLLCLLGSIFTCRSPHRFVGRKTICRFALVTFVAIAAIIAVVLTLVAPSSFNNSVQAFDANTGALLWKYDLPTWKWFCAAGDEEGFMERWWPNPPREGRNRICLPLASSAGQIDAQGIFYMGHLDGRLYAIQDRNNDGRIDEESEVCTFDTGGSFSSQGVTLVPGVLAIGTCDSLFVFKQ